MSDEARSSPAGARRELPDRYGPGRKELAVFAALVLVGFAVWFAVSPGVTSWLFGVDPPRWPDYLLRTAIAYGVLALVAGFVFPRGFYLWGLALNLHGPVVEALTIYRMEQAGVDWVLGGTQDIVGYIVPSALVFCFTVCCYTAASAAGAGLRVAGRRLVGHPSGGTP